MSESVTLGPQTDPSNLNIVLVLLGAFISIFGLISHVVKERLHISESLVALLLGIALGPVAIHLVKPSDYGNINTITLGFARLVIGIQLVLAGIQLPSLYLVHQWKSIAVLLLPIMTAKWVISALVIWLIFPISYLECLVIGACVTPTDPVLANAIVKGRYAEAHIPQHLREIISAEAGANDGFGYPFLFLAIYLLNAGSRGEAIANWFVHTWLYEIAFSVVFGLFAGLVARQALKFAEGRKWVDKEAFLSYFIALALFVIGICGMIGTDDLLAAFIAGNAFSLDNFYREQTEDCALQLSLDMLLNQAVFIWIGATMPFTEMKEIDPGWRILVMIICILIFGRLPAVMALYKFIPAIKTGKDALFAGWFGPVGVGAIFYVQVALPYFEDDPLHRMLMTHLKPLVYAVAMSSIVVHGVTVPVVQAGTNIGPPIASAGRRISRSISMSTDRKEPVNRLPRYNDSVTPSTQEAGPSRPINGNGVSDDVSLPGSSQVGSRSDIPTTITFADRTA